MLPCSDAFTVTQLYKSYIHANGMHAHVLSTWIRFLLRGVDTQHGMRSAITLRIFFLFGDGLSHDSSLLVLKESYRLPLCLCIGYNDKVEEGGTWASTLEVYDIICISRWPWIVLLLRCECRIRRLHQESVQAGHFCKGENSFLLASTLLGDEKGFGFVWSNDEVWGIIITWTDKIKGEVGCYDG